MNPEQFQRLMAVFDEVAALPHDRRGPVIDARLGGDAFLRGEIDALLAEHDRVDAPVATARGLDAVGSATDAFAESRGEGAAPLPVLKGAYRLLRQIGRGGMGVVYEAEQSFPRRRVALKAVRPDLATPRMLRRFRNEIELLARLHHPGIAQIYEAGFADEASPDKLFFVMELVDGLPLTRYATTHRLPFRERVELLRKVCDAVQHAHQRGVIHRDLKPGNILVTASGQPKILDFGVARRAGEGGEASMATHAGQVIGTPSYMSPEQIAGEPVDTRTDVYALGVIGYELLSGALPFDLSSTPIVEAARVLREDAAPPLSRHDRALRGDPELIVAAAMHRDRERRYASAAALADDLERLLAGRPIAARRDSASYVLGKLARRHWALVSLGGLLVTLLVAFGVVSSLLASRNAGLARQSEVARVAAERQARIVEEAGGRLREELRHARIDRARLEGSLGNVAVAEDALWEERVRDPAAPGPTWALRELYGRIPLRWTVRVDAWPLRAAASSAAGRLVIATRAGELAVYDLATGREIRRMGELGGAVQGLALRPDGRGALIGLADGRVGLVGLEEGGERRWLTEAPAHAGGVTIATISPSGRLAATGGNDRTIRVWDLGDGRQVASWPQGSDAALARLVISPDERTVAAVLREPATMLRVWSAGDGSPVRTFPSPTPLGAWCVEPRRDGKGWLVGSLDRRVRECDPETGEVRDLGPDFGGIVRHIAYSPDGESLLIIGHDTAWIRSAAGPDPPRSLGRQRRPIIAAAWADERTAVIVTEDGLVRAIDTRPDPMLARLTGFGGWCFSVAYSPDGRRLAIGDSAGTVAVVDVERPERRLSTGESRPGFRTRGLAFLGDSRTLVAGGMDGAVRVVDAESGEALGVMESKAGEIYGLAVDPAGTMVAVGHMSRVARVWDLSTRELRVELPPADRRVEGVAFSPDGKVLAASGPNAGVRLWDTATWSDAGLLPTAGPPWGVAFSPDGSRLLVSTHAGTLDVFDTATRTRLGSLSGHSRLVPAIAWSRDGRTFASGGEDGTVRLWDARALRALMTLEPGGNEIVTIAFHPTGRWLAASTAFQFTAVYDLDAVDACLAGNEAFNRARFAPPERGR